MNKLIRCAAVAAALSVSVNGYALTFTFKDLNVVGNSISNANAINNLNQIAGNQGVLAPNGNGTFNLQYRAAIWEDSNIQYAPLTYSNSNEYSYGLDINDLGKVTVEHHSSNGKVQGYDWDINRNQVTKSPPEPIVGSDNFYTFSTNATGTLAGEVKYDTYAVAAITDVSGITILGTLGGQSSRSYDVSDSGFVVGWSELQNGKDGSFIWDGDSMGKLQNLQGVAFTGVSDVNNLGQSVGFSFNQSERILHATLWNGTKAIDLDDYLPQDLKDAGWVLTQANGINDAGWIVGEVRNSITREHHAYVLSTDSAISPIPEPTTWAMMLAGLALLGFTKISRKKE